jgi:hypothetical protein
MCGLKWLAQFHNAFERREYAGRYLPKVECYHRFRERNSFDAGIPSASPTESPGDIGLRLVECHPSRAESCIDARKTEEISVHQDHDAMMADETAASL